jgi:hypothetical protein
MYGMVLARHARFPHIKSTGTIGLEVYQAIQNPNIFVSPMVSGSFPAFFLPIATTSNKKF